MYTLWLTVPTGIFISIIGFFLKDVILIPLGIFVTFIPFGIAHYGLSWRERTKGDWGSLIFIGTVLGLVLWLVISQWETNPVHWTE